MTSLRGLFVAAALVALTSACGGSGPTAPTVAPVAPVTPTLAAEAAFVPATTDLATCLQAEGQNPACFSANRMSTLSATLVATALDAPTNLSATVSGTTVTLTWNRPLSGDPDYYVIQAGSGSGMSDLANFAMDPDSSYTATEVPNGIYYVRVGVQGGGFSNEVVVLVHPPTCFPRPTPPRNLTSMVNGSTVTLNWEAHPFTSEECRPRWFVIEVGSRPGLSDLANIETNIDATTYTATGVGAGTYYVRVRERHVNGISWIREEIEVVIR